MIFTTLNRTRAHKPCVPGWKKLLRALGKTRADDTPPSVLSMGIRLPLAAVLDLCNPMLTWPWRCDAPSGVALDDLFVLAPEVDRPVSTDAPAHEHIGRVKYLARCGWNDAITLDVGVPCLGYWGPTWPVVDGNHRLWAAILRDDAAIDADIDGQLSHAAELLGVDESVLWRRELSS